MPAALSSVAHLLLAVAFLEIGGGLQGVLIPVRAHLEGFSTQSIGLLGTAYYIGFVAGCLAIPALVERVGHIRAFSGFAALAAATFLVYGLVPSVPVWLLLRLVFGFSFAGVYMAVESWLNERATTETRGRVLAFYLITSWIAAIAGKLVFGWSDPQDFLPFALVSIGICLAVVPVAFTTQAPPGPTPRTRLRVKELYAISPVGLIGCLVLGLANGAFWSLVPIYAQSRGLGTFDIGLFLSATVLGGALTQWPVGKWSDRADRRLVIALVCFAAALVAGALILQDKGEPMVVLALAFVFGGCALPLYGLCVAHANDQVPNDAFIQVSGDLLMMFGIGAIFGPYLASVVMSALGALGLFVFSGGFYLALACFAAVRMRRRPTIPAAEKSAFVATPRTTQAILPLDPRAPMEEAEAADTGMAAR